MKKKKDQFELNDDDFGLVLNAAVRYSLGRRTYMPSAVTGFIKPLLSKLNNRTLWCFDQDIKDKKYEGGYGDECDEKTWMEFHQAVRAEREKRGEKLYVSYRESEEK